LPSGGCGTGTVIERIYSSLLFLVIAIVPRVHIIICNMYDRSR
jgi:hypothetical protein